MKSIVRKVLEKLKTHNLIKIDARKEGIKISKEPNQITLLDILNATGIVEDSLFKVYENTNKECHIGKNINFILYDILIETKLAMTQKLDSITIQDSVENKPTQPTPIEIINITFKNNSISNLKNSLISIVDNEQLTRDEFNSNLLENIKKNFNIYNKNVGNLITKVEFNNQNILDITFNKTNNKYSLDTNFDKTLATLNNNVLSIPLNITSNFYTAIPVSNLNNLQSTITNYISNSNNMFTNSKFESQLNSDAFKKVIADVISTTQESIGAVSYTGTTLSIAPNSSTNSKVKFSSTQSNSILINGSLQLNIPSSNFYTAISLSEDTITNLRQEIINLINTNGVSKTFIDSYLPYEIKDLIDDVDTSNNQKLSNFVSIPTYSDNSIKIQLKNNIGKYKFTSYQSFTNNISITNEVIELNNIELSTNVTPQEFPEDWFTWNNNQIIGLSDVGLNQKELFYLLKQHQLLMMLFIITKH